MTTPIRHIERERAWLWKHELAKCFGVSLVTLRRWILKLHFTEAIEAYNPKCRQLSRIQVEQICDRLCFNRNDAYKMMNIKPQKIIEI